MMHDLGERSATSAGVTLTVGDGATSAVIRLATAGINPFVATDLTSFQCPVKL